MPGTVIKFLFNFECYIKNLINEVLYLDHKSEVFNDWNGNEIFNDWKGFAGDSDGKESACNSGGPG